MVNSVDLPLPVRPPRLKPLYFTKGNPCPSLEEILDDVCAACFMKKEKLISETRKEELVAARMIFCYVANVFTVHSDRTVCKLINRDRTTVLFALRYITRAFDTSDPKFFKVWDMYIHHSKLWEKYFNLHTAFSSKHPLQNKVTEAAYNHTLKIKANGIKNSNSQKIIPPQSR